MSLLIFPSRFKMVNQVDKLVNLGNFDFDEENLEQKSWMLFGCTYNKYLLIFRCHIFVIGLMLLVCATV